MRKLQEPNIKFTLHMPQKMYDRLEQYMLRYVGKTYGRNRVIVEIIDKFLQTKEIVMKIEDAGNNGTKLT